MHYGKRTYQEWQAMSPEMRDDFVHRLNEARKKEAKQGGTSMEGIQKLLSGLFGGGGRW